MKFPLPHALVSGNTCSSTGYEKAHGIHSKASVDSRLCQTYKHYYVTFDSCIGCLRGIRVTHFRPQYLSLSSNCIKMINTLHLLVTFTQDKCYTEYSQGENDLKFIDVARVISFKGKAAKLILQIKDEVYSSSANLLINRVILSSEV